MRLFTSRNIIPSLLFFTLQQTLFSSPPFSSPNSRNHRLAPLPVSTFLNILTLAPFHPASISDLSPPISNVFPILGCSSHSVLEQSRVAFFFKSHCFWIACLGSKTMDAQCSPELAARDDGCLDLMEVKTTWDLA